MANTVSGAAEQPRGEKPARSEGRFFTIYKPGQGYWTRMGTVFGAGLVGLFTANFLYTHVPVWAAALGAASRTAPMIGIGVAAGFLIAYALIIFRVLNKPDNADFLIATDSEMKKVNWTTRKELIGSTRVVILFMFLLAIVLFVFDIIFGYFFHAITVLQYGPFER